MLALTTTGPLAMPPSAPDHRGVAEDDPRNSSPIVFFKPKQVTEESARLLLIRSLPHAPANQIEMRVQQVMKRIATGPIKPPAPLSQSLEEVDDPHYGLDTHPDIIEHLWKLDVSLPQRCRWIFWGKPALVHPLTGVVFAVGSARSVYVMRLPPRVIEAAEPTQASVTVTGNPGQTFDIGPAGPEWRFITARAPEIEWCRAAYEFVGFPV
jgi:hypothetical protein